MVGEVAVPGTSVKVDVGPRLEDARGYLTRLLGKPIGSAVLIYSNRGTHRASHEHHEDWHYCYVIEGFIEYYCRPHGGRVRYLPVKAGEMVFTPPGEEHWMVFPQPTKFLTLADRERSQVDYEADLVRVPFLTEEQMAMARADAGDPA